MEQIKVYREYILKNFNAIEDITGIMINVSHPGLEVKFWTASDAKDLKMLKFIKNETDKMIDNLNEGN